MSSITKKTKQGVQPLAADDGILADSTSDGESPGVSEGDGPLRQADEAELITTISGDGPEILRGYAEPSELPAGASPAQIAPPGRLRDGSESPNPAARTEPDRPGKNGGILTRCSLPTLLFLYALTHHIFPPLF